MKKKKNTTHTQERESADILFFPERILQRISIGRRKDVSPRLIKALEVVETLSEAHLTGMLLRGLSTRECRHLHHFYVRKKIGSVIMRVNLAFAFMKQVLDCEHPHLTWYTRNVPRKSRCDPRDPYSYILSAE